ncbi:Putative DNA-binding domain-containing protein [Ruegeria halocynthiae]|uniref:Putative DNA-binding domain-containing protein n=1 Tax=Ruegeria halocynthiae TaxID=985054 RepID=A0A1H2UPW4_9RHOB|nr:DNA-binding domain-containing protein [Ruegeria halocynthiae]SDW57998.1 Putative DNA-binding domain-containing protein [Ruegeria halocynthiae]
MSVSQTTFHSALLDASQPIPDGLLDAEAQPAGRRFSVYRNNVAVSLTEAMHQAFPVIARLLGAQNMDGLSGIFLRQHPPTSPLMMLYGDEFPTFLEGMEQLSHLGYLPDVARLELALRHAYHAADSQSIDPDALSIPPEDLMRARLTLAPAAQVLRSDWPVHAIWLFNTEKNAPKPQAGAQDVLITRPEYDPAPHSLPPGGAAWILRVQDGQTIGEAFETTVAETPEFDLGTTLALLLQGGAITSVTIERLDT